MIKSRFFEMVKSGDKTVELRKKEGPWKNSKEGDEAVFMCGGKTCRKKIVSVYTGSLNDITEKIPFKQINPKAKNKDEFVKSVREIYPETDRFIAFEV